MYFTESFAINIQIILDDDFGGFHTEFTVQRHTIQLKTKVPEK